MNNKQNINKCYVFSQTTLDLALQEWLELETKNDPVQEESVLIALAALPWFLNHLKQTGPTFVFTNDVLNTEMEKWKKIQITDYPNQQQRIENTCEQLLNFFESDLITQYKMIVKTV